MFLALLLLASPLAQEAPVARSAAIVALSAQRGTIGDVEFVRRVEALAGQGDASAVELIGEAYLFGGFGLPRDPAKACDRFQQASASRGDAMHNLALCYERGDGRPQDPANARTLYARAAGMGWVQAKCALGTMLVTGRGGARDAARGVALCKEAAEAGNANAQTDYGGYLLIGEGVPRDVGAARSWLTAAAKQNQPNAAFLLAQIHWNGDGTPVDVREAERWWRVAYAGGRKDAAAPVARAIFKRIAPDGKTVTDRSLVPEWVKWLKIGAAEDPDPALRKQLDEVVHGLESGK
jgi:TPR repeat protein